MSLLNMTLNIELEFDSNLNIIVSLKVLSLLNLTELELDTNLNFKASL